LDVLVLQAAQPLVGASNGVERLDYLGLELRLDRGDREPALLIVIVIVEVALADHPAGCRFVAVRAFAGRFERDGGRGRSVRRRPGPSRTISGVALASGPAEVASRSMMSRSKTLPSLSSSRQMIRAWKVSALSQSPAIMASRPASMRLAIAISPSRERSSTEAISRRYMRTGSSVRSAGSLAPDLAGTDRCWTSTNSFSPFASF